MDFTIKATKQCACGAPIVVLRFRGPRDTCTPCLQRAAQARFKAARPERKRELNKRWAEANRESDHASKRKWELANLAACAAKTAKYLGRKRQAVPPWADDEATQSFYQLAAIYRDALGEEFHVDHIVPLQGAEVCGLHWHENLQILTGAANRSKSNRFNEVSA